MDPCPEPIRTALLHAGWYEAPEGWWYPGIGAGVYCTWVEAVTRCIHAADFNEDDYYREDPPDDYPAFDANQLFS